MIKRYVIFAIDNGFELRTSARFERYLDELAAMGKLKSKPKLCIGKYGGELERSYLVGESDFDTHIRKSGWVEGQECFLRLRTGHRDVMYAYLQANDEGGTHLKSLGQMVEITEEQSRSTYGWTYRLDTHKYYSTKPTGGTFGVSTDSYEHHVMFCERYGPKTPLTLEQFAACKFAGLSDGSLYGIAVEVAQRNYKKGSIQSLIEYYSNKERRAA